MKITWLILDPSMSPTTLLWALTPSPSSSTENSSSLKINLVNWGKSLQFYLIICVNVLNFTDLMVQSPGSQLLRVQGPSYSIRSVDIQAAHIF